MSITAICMKKNVNVKECLLLNMSALERSHKDILDYCYHHNLFFNSFNFRKISDPMPKENRCFV